MPAMLLRRRPSAGVRGVIGGGDRTSDVFLGVCGRGENAWASEGRTGAERVAVRAGAVRWGDCCWGCEGEEEDGAWRFVRRGERRGRRVSFDSGGVPGRGTG